MIFKPKNTVADIQRIATGKLFKCFGSWTLDDEIKASQVPKPVYRFNFTVKLNQSRNKREGKYGGVYDGVHKRRHWEDTQLWSYAPNSKRKRKTEKLENKQWAKLEKEFQTALIKSQIKNKV